MRQLIVAAAPPCQHIIARLLYWRKQKQLAVNQVTDSLPSVDTNPEDALLRQEAAEAVRLVLAAMPAEYVMVLTAKYTEQRSASDIANELGESVEAIRSRLARARREFRQRYEANETPAAGQLKE